MLKATVDLVWRNPTPNQTTATNYLPHFQRLQPATRVQFGLAQYSNTPPLRSPEFEDEDEDENETPEGTGRISLE